jgi:hypothetical protein
MSRVLMVSFHPDTFHCVHASLRLGRVPSKAASDELSARACAWNASPLPFLDKLVACFRELPAVSYPFALMKGGVTKKP